MSAHLVPLRDAQVLLLEDDGPLGFELLRALEASGVKICRVESPNDALQAIGAGWRPSIVVIDLLLPTSDLLAVGRAMRSNCAVPILLVLPGSDSSPQVEDASTRVHVLRRPFTVPQLVVRIERLLGGRKTDCPLVVGPLRYLPGTYSCTLGAERIDLSADEAVLLEWLMLHPGETVSRLELFSRLSGLHRDLDPRIVDVYVVRLMVKLGYARGLSLRPSSTQTGYVLEVDSESSPVDIKPAIPA